MKKTRGRPLTGVEPKVRALFSLDPGIFGIFKMHCKENKVNMSKLIQCFMHNYSVANSNK